MDYSIEPSLTVLNSKDFVPEKYVKDLSQNFVGGPELRRLRKKIQSLLEDTNNNLKKNVYENYMQFIDTAKEISHLESEMYQLSHLLSEQKSLLSVMSTTVILSNKTPIIVEAEDKSKLSLEEENRKRLASILEKVEGCKDIVSVPSRNYIYEGDLIEVDPLDNTVIKTIHGYLFNDGFMTCTRNLNNTSLLKYVFETLYELGSLAVVNVRETGNNKYQFKLLIFPNTRVFQCNSNSLKKEWLDHFDQAKKARLNYDQTKRESLSEKPQSASIDYPSLNPFEEVENSMGQVHPTWFLEISEELDVFIAERHFEDALNYLQKAKNYINSQITSSNNGDPDHIIIDIQRKINQKHNHLTEVLMKELEVNPDKSLQGGLRAARRAVRLLNQLGRSTQSCSLFLKLCSSMLKLQCKRVKREGSLTMYVRHLSSVVFTNLCHMSEEFLRAFPNSFSCSSAYVVWVSNELSLFTNHFVKQVFVPQTSLSVLTDCVVLVRNQCERLCSFGVDLSYQLDGTLRTPLIKTLRDAKDKIIDAVKLRSADDKWIPINLRSKSGLARCLQQYADFGLKLDSYVSGDIWIQLTMNTMSFAKMFLGFLQDCLRLQTIELLNTIDEILYDIFLIQIKHYEQALKNEKQNEQRQFIMRNFEFLLINLHDIAQKKYLETNSFKCQTIQKLHNEYSSLIKGISSTPTGQTRTKYSSEFL